MAASLQQQIDAMANAIAAGVARVRLPDGAEVQYPSLDALLQAKKDLEAQQTSAVGGGFYHPIGFGRPSL